MNTLRYLRNYLALFILQYVLGWRLKKLRTKYEMYGSGKIVAVYLHTSIYDHLISILFSYALDLDFITIRRSNSQYNQFLHTIVVDIANATNSDKKKICDSIVSNLNSRENFIVTINPEGSIYRTSGLKSGFYEIAKSTGACIALLDLNYNTHEVDLRIIADSNIIKTSRYERIIEIVTDEFVTTMPYDSTRTYILNRFHRVDSSSDIVSNFEPDPKQETFELFSNGERNNDREEICNNSGKPTSLINFNRSIIRFAPLLIVSLIAITIFRKILFYLS